MIPYENLKQVNAEFFDDYRASFDKMLESGWYILGNNVKTFEAEFAAYNAASYCAGVASGLDALILGLKAMDLPEKSEVIVPSNTYIASIQAIVQAGLTPILVEPTAETYNIDPQKIESAITKNTSAIMVVHLYGKPCEMDRIMDIAKQHHLKVIEDCAQAHGATFKGQKVGTFGDVGAFSFYPTKNLGALGDAGAVISYDETVIENVKMLRNYGSSKKYYNDVVGYNSRLDEVQAGFLSIKLESLDKITAHKRMLAEIYHTRLNDSIVKPIIHDHYFDVYHLYVIRHPKRDLLKQYLLDNGVGSEIHYPVPPHHQKGFKQFFSNSYPISEDLHRTVLSLPISYCHSADDIEQVIECANSFQ